MTTDAQCGRGWGDRCANAKSKRCTCRCGGRNHGKHQQAGQKSREMTESLPLSDLQQYQRPLARVLTGDRQALAKLAISCVRDPDNEVTISIAQRHVVHSPTGMEWGYGGSGPADFALNVLALFTTPQDAYALHQDFKDDCIARIPREGATIDPTWVMGWLEAKFREPPRPFWRLRPEAPGASPENSE